MFGKGFARRELAAGLTGAAALAAMPRPAFALTSFNALQQPMSPAANLPTWADPSESVLAGKPAPNARLTAPT